MPGARPPTPPTFSPSNPSKGQVRSTASFNTLMRLATLDDCVQDALKIRERIAFQIDDILKTHYDARSALDAAENAAQRLIEAQTLLGLQRAKFERALTEKSELQGSLDARRRALSESRRAKKEAEQYKEQLIAERDRSQAALAKCGDESAGQRRRMFEDLSAIYPIEPVSTIIYSMVSHMYQ